MASLQYVPGTNFQEKPDIYWMEDFFVGGRTIVDAVLAAETDPYAKFVQGVAADITGEWLVSRDTVVAETQLWTIQNDADGGTVKATTDATSGERISMQLIGEAFKVPSASVPASNRPIYFETKLKIGTVTSDAYFGLAVTGATDPHASRPLGAVGFTMTGDADIEYVTANASTATASVDTGTDLVADTMTTFGIWCDGSTARFYINGEMVKSTTTTVPAGMNLSPVFCIESNGAAEAMTIDYVMFRQRRG